MARIWKHMINITFGTVLVCALTAAWMLGKADRKPVICKGVSITITDSTTNQFITPDEIRRILDMEYKDYTGTPIDDVDLARVEKILNGKSAILKSQAYTTKDSMLNVTVTQRKPIVRFQKGGKGFYADSEGFLFPLQSTYTSHVQVIDGNIPLNVGQGYIGRPENGTEQKWLGEILNVVNFIERSRMWKEKIVQITVDKDGELIMVPREGRERFLFGQPVEIEDKFMKMGIYYKGISKDKGEGYYRWVDLRYEGQIVCRQEKENK